MYFNMNCWPYIFLIRCIISSNYCWTWRFCLLCRI